MFSKIPVMKVLALLCFIAATSAAPIFFGHPKQTQIFITPRKDTVSATVNTGNQIPNTLVKARPAQVVQMQPVQPVQMQPVQLQPVPIPVVPVVGPANVPKASPTHVASAHEMNKLFNEMKNSKKPFMTITMKAPVKSSLFPDPFSLFDENNEHIVVHVPYNVHTNHIHHHHVQHIPIVKHVPIIKHVPVVKEVAIPVHLTHYKHDEWAAPAAQWW